MPALAITRNYLANTVLTQAQLDAQNDSIETFMNTTKLDVLNLQDNLVFPGEDSVQLPDGTTAQRAGSPSNGDVRYNTDLGTPEARTNGVYLPFAQPLQIGEVVNLGLTLSAGLLSLTQQTGTALTTAAGYVGIPSTTDGRAITLELNTVHSFLDDAGASQIIGEQFGVTTGIAYGNDRPFYVYIANRDNTAANLRVFISPSPSLKQTPATALIGFHGTPMATPSDSGIFMWTGTDPTSTHANVPCVRIGGIRMQMSTSDDWTVSSLSSSSGDGIRTEPFVAVPFDVPLGQLGAESNNYFLTTNAPTWATPANIVARFTLDLDGNCSHTFSTSLAGDATAGGDAVICIVVLPYKSLPSTINPHIAAGRYAAFVAPTSEDGVLLLEISGGTVNASLRDQRAAAILNNDFSDSADDVQFHITYRAFE